MYTRIIRFFVLTICLLAIKPASSQPFINEINFFAKQDSLQPPPQRPILFIGSSSFTNWKDVQAYFPGYTILNRAFGGSSLTHQLAYAERVIFPYNPKQIIIYCGENDVAGGKSITADTVLNRFKRLHALIRSRLPAIPIVYVSMKPSPSRENLLPVIEEGNRLIRKYIRKKKKTAYADIYHKMFTKEGTIRQDIFLSDRLHMNKNGYEIWKLVLADYLIKD
jgi:lysophospholipase L1-like esterase